MRISGLGSQLRGIFGRGSRRSSRGTAELSVVVVAASLVLGVVFGDGLSRTSLNISDGLSWLKDEPSGEVIQVNPATGRPEARIDVGSPGDSLQVAQYDGRLVVINRSTGELTTFDLATLLASGQRSVTRGDASDVLIHDGKVFLLDRSEGTLSAIDPVTTDVIGKVWISDTGIVDAKIDSTGRVWAIDPDGLVSGLEWRQDASSFSTEETRTVKGSGQSSVLVAHESGVTVLGPDSGIVVQVGTEQDVVANAPRLRGTVLQPDDSPADLVPASAPETSTVVIVGRTGIREVNVASVACAEPGRPVVFRDVVYVPCRNAGKVIRLDRDGSLAGPDILLPDGGEAELVVDDGHLLINVQGADRGVQVMPDGSTRTFLRQDPSVPVQQVRNRPDAPRVDTPDIPDRVNQDRNQGIDRVTPPDPDPTGPDDDESETNRPDPGSGNGDDDQTRGGGDEDDDESLGGGDGPGDGDGDGNGDGDGTGNGDGDGNGDGTGNGDDDEESLQAPTNVTAQMPASGQAVVRWEHSGPEPDDFTISVDGGATMTTVDADAREAAVAGMPGGEPVRFVVTARLGDERMASSPSNPVAPPTPDELRAPTSVSASLLANGSVQVSWSHSGPAAENFRISRVGGGNLVTVAGTARQGVVSVPSGESSRFVVTAVNGSETAASSQSNAVTPSSRPGAPTNVSATSSFNESGSAQTLTVDVSWGAAPDNGSSITSYEVTVSGPNGSRTFTTNGSGRNGTATWTCDWAANPGCGLSGGDHTVSVTATNSQGQGAAGTISTSQSVPSAPLPRADRQIVTNAQPGFLGIEGIGQTPLTLAPPSDWANFDGVCRYEHTGNFNQIGGPTTDTGTVACDATSMTVSIHHGIIRGGPDPYTNEVVTIPHRITFTATNANGTVTSRSFTWNERQQTLCNQCQIP